MIRRLELRRGQVAERRMDALTLVDVVQEAPDLRVGVGKVAILRQGHLLFFDRPHQPLGIAVLPGFTLLGHTDPRAEFAQARHVGGGRLLHALVGVMDGRLVSCGDRPFERAERQRLIQMTRELPATNGPRITSMSTAR